MKNILVTGCAGLIGLEAVDFFYKKGFNIIGIDNNMREYFFGPAASVEKNLEKLKNSYNNFIYYNIDIRDYHNLEKIYQTYEFDCIIHTAAQPSHDWAVKEPFTDYSINSTGTINLLELTRKYCKKAPFIFVSTSKVYGDNPNKLKFIELDTRYDLELNDDNYKGFKETFSIDNAIHSLFGCSKLSADLYVQEYGKYFGMKTVAFRPGCLTGSKHKGVELHGFLNYLVKCNLYKKEYNIFGYKGKQVRCNINSLDLVNAFYEFYLNPKSGEVYNIGGNRKSNCSLIEAIAITEKLTGNKTKTKYINVPRIGDHIWWISDTAKFENDYPNWKVNYTTEDLIKEIIEGINV